MPGPGWRRHPVPPSVVQRKCEHDRVEQLDEKLREVPFGIAVADRGKRRDQPSVRPAGQRDHVVGAARAGRDLLRRVRACHAFRPDGLRAVYDDRPGVAVCRRHGGDDLGRVGGRCLAFRRGIRVAPVAGCTDGKRHLRYHERRRNRRAVHVFHGHVEIEAARRASLPRHIRQAALQLDAVRRELIPGYLGKPAENFGGDAAYCRLGAGLDRYPPPAGRQDQRISGECVPGTGVDVAARHFSRPPGHPSVPPNGCRTSCAAAECRPFPSSRPRRAPGHSRRSRKFRRRQMWRR